MKDFLIWIAVSIGSVFGMHSQPATTTISVPAPIVQTNSQSPAILARNIICPGGISCPNQGAINVSVSQNTWTVGNTYRVSWTNSLPNSSYDFYYVEIGVGTTSPRFPNGGDLGFYKVDGSKNYLDINFDSKTAEMRVLNSQSRNYDAVKNVFFVS